jgi:hypothetical protein
MFWKKFLIIAVAAIGVSLIAMACGDDDDDTADSQGDVVDANAQLCSDLAQLETSLVAVGGVTSSTTVDETTALVDTARDDWETVVDSADSLGEARVDTFESAQSDLRSAIDDVPGDASLDQAAASVSDQADIYRASVQQVFSELDCS